MGKLREVIIILALAVVMCLAAEFLTGFLIYNSQADRVKKEYTEMADSHAESTAARAGDACEPVFTDMAGMTESALAAKYGLAGTFQAGHTNQIIKLSDGRSNTNLSQSVVTGITGGEKTLGCYQRTDLLNDNNIDYYMLYALRDPDDDVIYKVVLQKADGFLASLSENYFNYTAVVASNSRVCVTNYDSLSGEYFYRYESGLEGNVNWINEYTPRSVTVEGAEFFAACRAISYSQGSLGMLGLIDYQRLSDALSETLSFVFLIMILFGLLILAVIIGLTLYLLYMKQHSFSSREIARENYSVTVNSVGEVVKSGKNFKKFSKVNIFDAAINKDAEMRHLPGSNPVCYLNRDGADVLVSFIIIDKDDKSNFRMVGVEIDASKAEEYKKEYEDDFSLRHSFKNRYVKATLMDSYKIIAGIIEITNIKKLQTMFGPKVSRDVIAATDERIKKYAETVYPLDSQNKGILITKEKEVEFFQNDIKEFIGELNKPVTSGDMLVDVNACAGFVLIDQFTGDKSYDYMIKCAQAALKRVHAGSGPKHYVFHDSVKKQYIKYFDYDFDIGKMLDEEDFEMQYQPQYSMKEGKIVAFEALFRVKEHLGLQIDIGRLIDYIQYEGQIGVVGKFTFDNCLRFAKEIEGKGVKLSVNVSPLQFMQVGFVSTFAELVKKFEVDPSVVDIEITETFLLGNVEEAANKIVELKKYGIGVHLDDFGKEYSSLNYLNKMPVEAVKIDRDFIIPITQNEKSRTLVQSIIDMVHKLGILTIAEGVETEDQFKLLKEMKCDLIQGYYIGKAMTEKRVIDMLNGTKGDAK